MLDWICGKVALGWIGRRWFREKDAYILRSSAKILYEDDRLEAMELINILSRIGLLLNIFKIHVAPSSKRIINFVSTSVPELCSALVSETRIPSFWLGV